MDAFEDSGNPSIEPNRVTELTSRADDEGSSKSSRRFLVAPCEHCYERCGRVL